MSFLYPVFLAGALAIAVPIVLHLLRRDVAPEIPFSAVRLLRRTPVEQTRRRRIRDLLLLLARITALFLLAAAFARPYLPGLATESPLRIVAIDRSFSMGVPGRFERALELAREAIDAAASQERIAVIAFDDRADVLARPGSASEARRALNGLRAGFGGTRYVPVLVRAMELSDQADAALIIVTDMQRAGWEDEDPVDVPEGLRVETRDAGATSSNLAVAAVRREERAVVASVKNAGSNPVVGTARALVEGRIVASASFNAPPNATVDVPIAYRAPARGFLAVEIDDAAGYEADNCRYLVLDPQTGSRVLIVGDTPQSGFYLTRALESVERDVAFDVRVRPARSLGSLPPEEFTSNRAVVLLSTRSLDRRARDLLVAFIHGGGGLLVTATPDVEAAGLASLLQWSDFSAVEQSGEAAVLTATDLRHPIFRPFGALAANLGQVRFTRAWLIRTGDGWEVAARFTDGSPALLERREGKGRVVVFASDLDRQWNDFPLNPAFVPFVVEAVRHLAASANGRRDYLIAATPPGARPQPGVYTLPEGDRTVAVNVDIVESAIARMSASEFSGMFRPAEGTPGPPVEQRAQQTEERQSLWRYGLMLMLVALVAESFTGRIR